MGRAQTVVEGLSNRELLESRDELSTHIDDCCGALDGTCPWLELYGEFSYWLERERKRDRGRGR